MIGMNVTHLITMIIDYELRKKEFLESAVFNNDGSITRKGLLFDVWLTLDGKSRRFAIAACGNISIFFKEVDLSVDIIEFTSNKGWINSSNHDSCWRTDGLRFLDKAYFEMCETLKPNKAPIDCNVEVKFGICNTYPRTVRINFKNDPNNTYRYKIVKISC